MSDLSRELIQRSREAYAKLKRVEGADYFEAQEAFNRSVQDARARHREQLNKASSVTDLAPGVLGQIANEMESGAQEWTAQELDASDSTRKAAAIRLAQSERPPMGRGTMKAWFERYGPFLDPLPHLLALCRRSGYPEVLFWKDKLVDVLSRLPGMMRVNNTPDGIDDGAVQLWSAMGELCGPDSPATLPFIGTIARLGGEEDFLAGLRVLYGAAPLVDEVCAKFAIHPTSEREPQPSHPGRRLPLSQIAPMRNLTNAILVLHGELSLVRDFLGNAPLNGQTRELAIGYLASRDSHEDWSMLVAMLDSLLGQTDVPYDGLMLREGRSPYIFYDHGPMHRYGRAQAQYSTVRGTLEAGERLFAAMEDYLMALRLRSAEALVAPLRAVREPACVLAALDADV
jgi:hypothetical protein